MLATLVGNFLIILHMSHTNPFPLIHTLPTAYCIPAPPSNGCRANRIQHRFHHLHEAKVQSMGRPLERSPDRRVSTMSATIAVSSLAELISALSQVKGGETILLAGGDYGRLALTGQTGINLNFPDDVKIASADPEHPAVFSGLDVRNTKNLTFEDVVFDYQYTAGDPIHLRPFSITGSENITIKNSIFDGDVATGISEIDDGYGYAIGLSIRNSSDVTIEGNEFFNFHRAATFSDSHDLIVRDNNIHSIRMDGFNFSAVQKVLIEDNHFHNFITSKDSTDHSDMIQFWTAGTSVPSTDITIRNNHLDVGEGGWTQSIFMRNEVVDRGQAGYEMFYQNILIEGNVIYNGHLHGITLGEANNVVIRENSVLWADSTTPIGTAVAPVNVPTIRVSGGSTNVEIYQNATAGIFGWQGQPSWNVFSNAIVQGQDSTAPGYYGDVFVFSTLVTQGGAHSYVPLAGGVLEDLAAIYKTLSIFDAETLAPIFHVQDSSENVAVRVFKANPGAELPPGTEVLWTFGDGISAKGLEVQHAFPDGGRYTVEMTLILPDGRTSSTSAEVKASGSKLVSMDAGGLYTTSFGVDMLVVPTENGLKLGAPGVTASIARDAVQPVLTAESLQFSFLLAASAAGASGELFRLHQSFLASVTAKGELDFRLFTDEGTVRLITKGASLNDLSERNVIIRFEENQLEILVDGIQVGQALVSSPMTSGGNHNLTFGNQWNAQNFNGVISMFDLEVNMKDHAEARDLWLDAQARMMEGSVPPADDAHESDPGDVIENDGGSDTPEWDETSDGSSPTAPWQSALHSPEWNGFVLAISDTFDESKLKDDASVVHGQHGSAIRLDGDRDYVDLGRMRDLEQSDRIAFSVDFTRASTEGDQRLVWNHQKLGLTLSNDGLIVQVATANNGFKAFRINDLGLGTDELHRVIVKLDAAEDRLQVIVDEKLVLDEQDTDFMIVGAGGGEWGWMLGTPWNRYFDGEILDFRLGDEFEFMNLHHDPLAA